MQNLQWLKEDETFYLKNNEEVLVRLAFKLTRYAEFNIYGNEYKITRKGIWNTTYLVEHQNKEIAKFSNSLWGSTGTILFNDQSQYTCIHTSSKEIKIVFLQEEEEVLSYELPLSGQKTSMIMKIGTSIIDAEKILILSVLGFLLIYPIFIELKGSSHKIFSTSNQ